MTAALTKRLAPRRWLRIRELARSRPRTFLAAMIWPLAYLAAWLWRRTWLRNTRLIAVTGSVGKTSTAAAVAAVLGVPFDPNARNFGSFLARALLRHSRHRPLVVEVGISRRGQMRRYAQLLRPDVVLLTAIAEDHAQTLGGIEGVQAEKARLAHAVRPNGLLVVNGDDSRCLAIAASARAKILKVGYAADCEWRIEDVRVEFPHGTRIRLAGLNDTVEIATPWIGEGLARCTALAAAFGLESGFGYTNVREGLAGLRPTSERLEAVPLPSGAWMLCDTWKASWKTFESAFSELGKLTGWRRIAVLGDIDEVYGDRSATYHQYARLAVASTERIVYVGRNFKVFRGEARRAGVPPGGLRHCRDVYEAAAALAPELAAGTVILVKGGHRQKLGRIKLLLQGVPVSCELRVCPRTGLSCELCPQLQSNPVKPKPERKRA